MQIVMVEPGKAAYAMELEHSLKAMQQAVGGAIQILYPLEEPVALVCHEEGKLLGLPPNRGLWNEEGRLYDIVCGPFFLCSAPPQSDRLEGLTEGQVRALLERFGRPEFFVRVGEEIFCLPMEV